MDKTLTTQKVDGLLYDLVAGTAEYVGQPFFRSLVKHLAKALDCRYAFVAEFAESKKRVRTLAYWSKDGFIDNVEFDIAGTPCERVLAGQPRLYPQRVAELFPEEKELVDMEAESYLAIPLFDTHGEVMGHLAVIDDSPMDDNPTDAAVLRIFGSRVAAEMERRRSKRALEESEAQLSAILESTLDAILVIDARRRIKLFNHAAEAIFGYCAREAAEMCADRLFTQPFRGLLEDRLEFAKKGETAHQLWAPEGLSALHRDGTEIPVELTISQCQVGEESLQTLILRNVNAREAAQVELIRLRGVADYLHEEIGREYNVEGIVSESREMQKVLRNLERVAGTGSTVLITGETGVGKELVARAIHAQSERSDMPLVKVNCAALPAELIESELFGHERGAFTGAVGRRKGRFELADRGTFFLDEIAELTQSAQAKLLRVLQEGEFERVGGTETIRVDVRLIAATNRDLGKMVEDGSFRGDLFYRLNVFPIRIPPLRDRKKDIVALARHLIEKLSRQLGKPLQGLSGRSSKLLLEYPWPGNVRELQNVLERCAILADGLVLEVPGDFLTGASDQLGGGRPRALNEVERDHIIDVLIRSSWVIEGDSGAAAALSMAPSTLRSRMKKLGIRRNTGR